MGGIRRRSLYKEEYNMFWLKTREFSEKWGCLGLIGDAAKCVSVELGCKMEGEGGLTWGLDSGIIPTKSLRCGFLHFWTKRGEDAMLTKLTTEKQMKFLCFLYYQQDGFL